MEEDDARAVELECLAAIYPEMVLGAEPYTASLEIPVHPASPVKVIFPAPADVGTLPTPPESDTDNERERGARRANLELHNLNYLPSLNLHLALPDGYPAEAPPRLRLTTAPQWLSQEQLDALQAKSDTIWEEHGRTEMVFDYIDSLQQAAENAFGCGEGKDCQVALEHMISLLDFDIKAVQAAFDKETFDCGICLDPKKGTVCHKMIDCGHVFCVQCLQDFYTNAIKEGDLVSVRCLSPNCAKKRDAARKGRKSKTHISPSELLQIPLENDIVTRYVTLKHKVDLESDKNTVYCPRKWCQGAARSKKHRKPDGLEVVESDDESDTEQNGGKLETFKSGKDLLSVCEDCSFAFCSRCYQGWHGEFFSCGPRKSNGELTEEEKASLEYLKLYTTPCPTCAAPCQKTHGCNHMICFKCQNHFCYLCSSWLAPQNPYKHYNEANKPCFQRLWELERGHEDLGDNVDVAEAEVEVEDGGDQLLEGNEVEDDPVHHALPPFMRDDGMDGLDVEGGAEVQGQALEPAVPVVVLPRAPIEREGPLVLRINNAPRPVAPAVPAVPAAPAVIPRAGHLNARADQAARRRNRANDEAAAEAQNAANQAWVRRFVQMALNDE